MTKKILLSLFVLVMAATSIIFYNFYKNTKQPVSNNSIVAVPQNAALILQENNFKALFNKLSSTNIIWEELAQNTSVVKSINNKMMYLDSLFRLNEFKHLINHQSILTSLHLSGANNFNFIFYIPISSNISENELTKKIKTTTAVNLTSRAYDDVNIYTTTGNSKISFTYYKNIFAVSYSTVLIEDVIRQLNGNTSLLDNKNFKKIFNTAGEVIDGNLFINNNYFPKVLSQFVENSAKNNLEFFKTYANWTELDINIKSNSLMFNGFTHSSDSSNNYLSLFKNQKPQTLSITSVIPKNTALLYCYGFSNANQFFKDRKKLLKKRNEFFNYQKFIDNYIKNYNVDLEEEFLKNIGNELAFVITESLNNDFKNNKFIVFQANNIDQAKENLVQLGNKLNQTPVALIEFKDCLIKRINFKNVFKNLLGNPFINIDNPFYTTIDDYFVFGNTESAIKTYINDYKAKKTLENNDNFQAFSDNLSSKTNIFIYNNIARSVNLYKKNAQANFVKEIDEKTDFYRKFEAIAFQVNSDKNDFYYNNIFLKYNPVYKQDTRTLWEATLDTSVNNKPFILKNHKTGAKDIFVQDITNKIYLISNTGKILWTKQLGEKIIGEPIQIDVYKNNKLQMLFNTKSKIYLLDRNGKDVNSFPVQLKFKATNAIVALDYEHNRNYRLLIGCNNNMVYNYNTDGKLVDGWKYSLTDSPANGKIWHFQLSNKDYIVIALQNGAIKVVQRNGMDRLQITNKLPITSNTTFLVKGKDLKSTYLLAADSTGTISKLYLNNQLETLNVEDANNQFFGMCDVNKDKIIDFIFVNNNKIMVANSSKSILFKQELSQKIISPPLNFTMLDKTKRIGIVTKNEIYLINFEGDVESDFPLTGSTSFSISDINNDNVLNLVVGDKNMIYTYSLKLTISLK